MEEIEAKILEINKHDIISKLISLGAKQVFDGELYVLYFDFPDGSLKKKKIMLRLRKEGDDNFLVLKKFISDDGVKKREESSLKVDDFETAHAMIESLGFVLISSMKKHRTGFSFNKAHVDIDTYLGEYSFVPTFLEIEAVDEKSVYDTAELLGFGKNDCKPWSGGQVIKHYCKARKEH